MSYVERKSELKRRRSRQAKMRKLKTKLAKAKSAGETQLVLSRIKKISPFWTQPATN